MFYYINLYKPSRDTNYMRWANVLNFEDRYEVSDTGLLRSKTREYKYIRCNKPCTGIRKGVALKPKLTWDGYREAMLQGKCSRKYIRLHRVIWESFNSKIPKGLVINHIDGDKLNNVLSNLEVVTVKENNKHAWENGLCSPAKGEDISILTKQQVLDIRKRVSEGEVQRQLAAEYGVGKNCIWHIVNRTTWRHI